MSQHSPANAAGSPKSKKREPLKVGYQCSRCDKMLPSIEAGEAHLQKKHAGHGFLAWQDYRNAGVGA